MNRRALAWLALNHIPGAGAVTLWRVVSRFGSPEAAVDASPDDLIALGSLSPSQAHALKRAADPLRLEALATELERAGAKVLTIEDDGYPMNLRALRDAPPLLYLRGSLIPDDSAAVAVVGTRNPSREGAETAHDFSTAIAARGITVVSGLALGIDGAAHRGALAARSASPQSGDARSGRTIAVLGSCVQRVTPREHRSLAEEIVESGALLSEAPPGTRAGRETLLARNRIQAGLAKAVIVIQCRSRGGSFSTARRALQAGRLVLAIRWAEAEFAAGTERLEQMGARVVAEAEAADIAAEAAFSALPQSPQPQMLFENRQ